MRILICLVLLTALPRAHAQVYAVKAGDILAANYRAAGGVVVRIDPATGGRRSLGVFDAPTDLAMAPDGHLYIAERGGAVKRLDLANGTVTLVNTNSTLTQVWGIALGPDGSLYVTSGSPTSNRITRINPATGEETEVAHDGQMSPPIGIEFLDADHLVVASLLNSRVLSVSLLDGTQTSLAGGGIDLPWGIAVHDTDVFVGAHDSKQLQRIRGGVITNLATLAAPPYGIATDANGNIAVAISGGANGPYAVLRFDADGNTLNTFSGPLIGEITGLDVAPVSIVAESQVNTPPLVPPGPVQTIDEGATLVFTPEASDTDWPIQTLTYTLMEPVPAGATISSNGLFVWKPTEPQGPATNVFSFRVADDGVPSLSVTQSFTVIVREVNSPPVITPPGLQIVTAGTTLAYRISATDTDLPPQTLTFSLEAGAPAGAAISSDGEFTWSPGLSQPPGDYTLGVVVSDNGDPILRDTNHFMVQVRAANSAPVLGAIANRTVNEGARVSVQFTATDADVPAQRLTYGLASVAPAGVTVSASGLLNWVPTEAQGPSTNVIDVWVADNGTPPMSATGSVTVIVNEVNRSPTLTAIPDRIVYFGETLAFTVEAQDTDLPAQELTFSLGPGVPAGASISPTGEFTWMPAAGQAPSSNVFTVTVTDNGIPSLSRSRTFVVEVRGGYVLNVGDIVVADYGASSVVKIDGVTKAAQTLGSFPNPTDVAVSPEGVVYVSEQGGAIERLNLQSGIISVVNPGSSLADLRTLALSPDGDLLVGVAGNDSIVRVEPATGAVTPVTQGGFISGPFGIALRDANHLVVSSFYNDSVVLVALTNNTQYLLVETNGLNQPWGIAADHGLITVASYGAGAIQTVSEGAATDFITLDDAPAGISVSTNGDVYVAISDGVTSRISKFNSAGALLTDYPDGLSGFCMGLEVVTPPPNPVPDPSLALKVTDLTGGNFLIQFEGLPVSIYDIETTPTLSPASWQSWLRTNTDGKGMITVTDRATNGAPSKFYRTILRN